MRARTAVAALVMAAGLTVGEAAAQDVRLEFAAKPRLIDCDSQPCARLVISAVDRNGEAVAIDDRTTFHVTRVGETAEIPIVYKGLARIASRPAGAGADSSARAQTRRTWLVLFDTSGSMNQALEPRKPEETKFAVARRQLERLLSTFQEGIDQMAIAPFDSRQVAERIRTAQFETTKAGIARQMGILQPRRGGNTALLSAVTEGLQKVRPLAAADGQVSIVVFTDGKNDVGNPGDDPGLLDGEAGLRAVTALASEVGVTIYTVGYGSSGVVFDEPTLLALKYPAAWSNYFSVSDEARLTQVFDSIVKKDAQLVTLLVGPLGLRREQLSGESLNFVVTAGNLTGESPVWLGNPLAPPAFEGEMTRAERERWIQGQRPEAATPLNPVFMRLMVLFVYGGLLAALWFGVPRLVWPDRYVPKPALRAASARPAQRPPSRSVPQPPGRSPAARPDATVPAGRPAPRSASPPDRGREPPAPDRGRERPAPDRGREPPPPPRPREQPPAPPRPRDAWNSRDQGDATVFIPPSKKPGGPR